MSILDNSNLYHKLTTITNRSRSTTSSQTKPKQKYKLGTLYCPQNCRKITLLAKDLFKNLQSVKSGLIQTKCINVQMMKINYIRLQVRISQKRLQILINSSKMMKKKTQKRSKIKRRRRIKIRRKRTRKLSNPMFRNSNYKRICLQSHLKSKKVPLSYKKLRRRKTYFHLWIV